jgi:hypothetical protein
VASQSPPLQPRPIGLIFRCACRLPLKPNGHKRIGGQTEMLLSIAGKKSEEAAAKLCARSRLAHLSA